MPEINLSQLKQQRFAQINKIFLIYNSFLSLFFLFSTMIFVQNPCLAQSCLIYFFLYLAQSVQHYCIYIFPKIDINLHFIAYRRVVIGICMMDMAYFFVSMMFWQKSQTHPFYCTLCIQQQYGPWVGVLFILHVAILIGWGATLIQAYISRRYYLLALGGFQVERRIIAEREVQANLQNLIEPDVNMPLPKNPKNKYYKFEDVIEQKQQDCSICLNKNGEDHFVDAGCGHFYHKGCIQKWSEINQKCPQCRKQFPIFNNKQQIIELQNVPVSNQ